VTFDGDYYPQVARGCPRATLEDYDMYYTEEEMNSALTQAITEINLRTSKSDTYKRGHNDCFAFLALYDEILKGKSKAFDEVLFEWDTTKEFVKKLYTKGYTIRTYLEYCGYEIIKSKRPKLGDTAFYDGAMICDGRFWVSTNEDNTGIRNVKQKFFFESTIPVIARPTRS
jgi:hypothetical protein